MPISYGGISLLLEDADDKLRKFMREFQDTCDTRHFGPPPAVISGRWRPRELTGATTALGIENHPLPPRLRLNTLYWPTGATRWATFYGLADQSRTQAILATTENGIEPAALGLKDSASGDYLGAEMWLLPPRPITSMSGQQIYLLPFVDERFFWQFQNVGAMETLSESTAYQSWQELVNIINENTDLGVALSPTATSVAGSGGSHGVPFTPEFKRDYENVAVILDSIAACMGCRVVQSITGQTTIQALVDAQQILIGNSTDTKVQIAGGFAPTNLAAGDVLMTVTCPVYNNGLIDRNGQRYSVLVGSGDTPANQYIVHTSAPADFSPPAAFQGGTGTPNNAAALTALANALLADRLLQLQYTYDATAQGIALWQLNAYDDSVEWCAGELQDSGTYKFQTRVKSLPFNHTVDELPIWLNKASTTKPFIYRQKSPRPVRVGEGLFNIPGGFYGATSGSYTTTASAGHANAYHVNPDGTTSNNALQLVDRTGSISVPMPGDIALAYNDADTNQWQVAPALPSCLFKNSGGSTIPPFGLVIQSGVTSYTDSDNPAVISSIKTMTQQGTSLVRQVFLIGAQQVTASAIGVYQTAKEQWGHYSTGGSWTPAIGDLCGPSNGSYSLTFNSPGFEVAGTTINDTYGSRVLVKPVEIDGVRVTTNAAMSQGSSLSNQPVSIGIPGSLTTIGINVPIFYDQYMDPVADSGKAVASGATWDLVWRGMWIGEQANKCPSGGGGS